MVEFVLAKDVIRVRFPTGALIFKMKKCPVCNSSKITKNEKGEIECKRCGYTHSEKKDTKITNS